MRLLNFLFIQLSKIAFVLFFFSYAPTKLLAEGTPSHSSLKPKICLNMIVKNESHIIERCLTSVKGIVDCISICDTGSDDNTIELIERFMRDNHIPGKVHRHEWQNFETNRTHSFKAAQQTLQEFAIPLANTYLLLIDADMQLGIDPSFKKESLNNDAYYLRQQNTAESCDHIRLIRASLPWECLGVTHEYWFCPKSLNCTALSSLKIHECEETGSKEKKVERDIALLTAALEKEPNDAHHIFYLALSYKALKKFDEAIKLFQARIALGGEQPVVWYSKLSIGKIYEELGFWTQALPYYLDAYADNPQRAEPLQKIASHYRFKGQIQLAYLFAKAGLSIPYPPEPWFFVSHPVYDYQLDEDMAVAAYYTSFKEEGFAAANRLILKEKVPEYVKNYSYQNLLFYVSNLPDTQFIPLEMTPPLIKEGENDHYNPMNASILKTDKGYCIISRTVNFLRHIHEMKLKDPNEGIFQSRNFLLECDTNFKVLSQKEIVEDFPRENHSFPFRGLDDCRIFNLNGEMWFTCATFGTHSGIIGQTLCKLANQSADKTIQVERFIPLQVPNPERYEKNWLPFIKDGKLFVFYLYEPWTVFEIDKKTGKHTPLIQPQNLVYNLSRFRGSAAPIEFDGGYLMLVHEVVSNNDYITYLHRFLFLDQNLNIKKMTKPFTFKHKGIEFCLSMTFDHSGENCILPISINEGESWICKVSLNTIRSLLESLPLKL